MMLPNGFTVKPPTGVLLYASVCSGIEGASVAWSDLGWIPIWFCEIDEDCSAVLKSHYPSVENLGDISNVTAEASRQAAFKRITEWMSSSAEHRASPLALPGCEEGWMTLVGSSPFSSSVLSTYSHLAGLSGRTSPVSCTRTEEGRLAPSSGGWLNAGMGGLTESWTLQASEFPSAAVESSLSDITEDRLLVPPQSFLTVQQIGKMAARLKRNNKQPPPELSHLLCSDGPGTKPQSSQETGA